MTLTVHQLEVSLRDVAPRVWRRIMVPSEMTLDDLAAVLEAAMGWLGGHLHLFDIDGTEYSMHSPEFENLGLDESEYTIGEVPLEVGTTMRWDYDFGDGWQHDVKVEAITPFVAGTGYPICLEGERACPPEDCGGPWGYEELVKVLADPDRPDPNEIREWISEFDPAEFDPAEATAAMRSPRPTPGW